MLNNCPLTIQETYSNEVPTVLLKGVVWICTTFQQEIDGSSHIVNFDGAPIRIGALSNDYITISSSNIGVCNSNPEINLDITGIANVSDTLNAKMMYASFLRINMDTEFHDFLHFRN